MQLFSRDKRDRTDDLLNAIDFGECTYCIYIEKSLENEQILLIHISMCSSWYKGFHTVLGQD